MNEFINELLNAPWMALLIFTEIFLILIWKTAMMQHQCKIEDMEYRLWKASIYPKIPSHNNRPKGYVVNPAWYAGVKKP